MGDAQRVIEDKAELMVGWHHRCYGHEFEQASGVGDGQRGLACCHPWGHKELDTTERLNLRFLEWERNVYRHWELLVSGGGIRI